MIVSSATTPFMEDEMTDTATAPEQAEAAPTEGKPTKVAKQPRPCYCQSFELVDPEDTDTTFTTGCEQTTLSTFAQGHDARLVSFLVDGYLDKYQIHGLSGGKTVLYATPAEAAATASDALRDKAEKATANKVAKRNAVQERKDAREALKAKKAEEKEAAKAAKQAEKDAKANAPKATGAEVVSGSATGDVAPLAEGQVRIKVGRWEYVATQNADGGVTFTNGKGEVETREQGDGYQVLETYQAA